MEGESILSWPSRDGVKLESFLQLISSAVRYVLKMDALKIPSGINMIANDIPAKKDFCKCKSLTH